MKLTETVMRIIGLEPVSNREKLMEELETLDGKEFLRILKDGALLMKIDCLMCEDCRNENGGRCPYPDDDQCATSNEKWLEATCTRETLIGEA